MHGTASRVTLRTARMEELTEKKLAATVVSRSAYTGLNQSATRLVLKHVLKYGSGRFSEHTYIR